MKYYEITGQEMTDIRSELPLDIAFGFESYDKYFFTSDTVDKIDKVHGRLIDLIVKSLFSKTRGEFFAEKISTSYEKRVLRDSKNKDGEAAYHAMLGHIEDLGGIGNSLDTETIPAYLELTKIRFMLKDGYFELALRAWFTDLKPLDIVSADIENFAVPIMESLCLKYGVTQTMIDAIKTAPKGSI